MTQRRTTEIIGSEKTQNGKMSKIKSMNGLSIRKGKNYLEI